VSRAVRRQNGEVRVRVFGLAPMTDAEYLTFRGIEARGYADDKVRVFACGAV
jgi:hypothetical protein